jgi:dephospho-CoA kinase
MLKIGITGGIGSGKTMICGIFNTLGIPIYDADEEAKKLYDTHEELKQKIRIHFGESVYEKGLFVKQKMANIVFNDNQKLKLLNQLVHPIVQSEAIKWFGQQQSPYAIKEAALLVESGSYKDVDKIILVTSPAEMRMKRAMERDHVEKESVLKRMQKQLSDQEKAQFADFIITNDGVHLLIPQVVAIHASLMRTEVRLHG